MQVSWNSFYIDFKSRERIVARSGLFNDFPKASLYDPPKASLPSASVPVKLGGVTFIGENWVV